MFNATKLLKSVAGLVAASPLLARARRLHDLNVQTFHLRLSKVDKALVGGYMVLRDYAVDAFPPTFEDQAKAYQAEIDLSQSLPGLTVAQVQESDTRKPFWDAGSYRRYSTDLWRLFRALDRLGLKPGARLLELGCGGGWTAECLALAGYSVTGTTLGASELAVAEKRAAAFRLRGLGNELRFCLGAMESVDAAVADLPRFDGVFVFEALHHAFAWTNAIEASYRCLSPGGWLILANEPNLFHTLKSYRVGKLTRTHEIGMSRRKLLEEMRRTGFKEVIVLAPRFDNLFSAHWIAARK
jgi:SAM-dependent methyltransferase